MQTYYLNIDQLCNIKNANVILLISYNLLRMKKTTLKKSSSAMMTNPIHVYIKTSLQNIIIPRLIYARAIIIFSKETPRLSPRGRRRSGEHRRKQKVKRSRTTSSSARLFLLYNVSRTFATFFRLHRDRREISTT